MLDYQEILRTGTEFWAAQDTTNPNSINGFAGKFAFESHQAIPSALMNVLAERFYDATRFTRVELDDINDFLNSVWEGPGSMTKITAITHELRTIRKAGKVVDKDALFKGYVTPTVDSDLKVEDEA